MPLVARFSDLQFADDLAMAGITRESMEKTAYILDDHLKEWGLTLSVVKIKFFCGR